MEIIIDGKKHTNKNKERNTTIALLLFNMWQKGYTKRSHHNIWTSNITYKDVIKNCHKDRRMRIDLKHFKMKHKAHNKLKKQFCAI